MPTLRLALVALLTFATPPWTPQTSGTTAEFRGLSVVDANTVWASGARGTFARTTDGGRSWHTDTIAGAKALDFRDIEAVSATVAYASSAGEAEKGLAKIYKTVDGGQSWSVVYTTDQKGVFIDALSFWDANHGIAMSDPVDGKLFLLRTDDGGKSWTQVPPAALPPMRPNEAAFAASGTCLAVQGSANVWIATGGADTARVFRSTDRGKSWSVASTPVHAGGSAAGIFSVAFVDAMHGVVVGGDYQLAKKPFDNVALTSDGGRSWRIAKGPLPQGYMSGVAYAPGTSGKSLVAVGLAGTAVSIDAGESWTMVDSIAYNSVALAGASDAGWAVGPRGRIAKWTGTIGK